MNNETALKILDIQLPENDADAATVRDYLKELLSTVLIEEEEFSGKRPFGNSGWIYDLVDPIHEAGFCSERPNQTELIELWSGLVGAI